MKFSTIVSVVSGLFIIGAAVTTVLVNIHTIKKNKAEKTAVKYA